MGDVPNQVSGDSEAEALDAIASRCPKCKGPTATGYGLMGGGVGAYEFCLADACDWMSKEQDGAE